MHNNAQYMRQMLQYLYFGLPGGDLVELEFNFDRIRSIALWRCWPGFWFLKLLATCWNMLRRVGVLPVQLWPLGGLWLKEPMDSMTFVSSKRRLGRGKTQCPRSGLAASRDERSRGICGRTNWPKKISTKVFRKEGGLNCWERRQDDTGCTCWLFVHRCIPIISTNIL